MTIIYDVTEIAKRLKQIQAEEIGKENGVVLPVDEDTKKAPKIPQTIPSGGYYGC